MWEFILVAVVIVLIVALGGGYYIATHQHKLAMDAASALSRATTVSGGDVAALNAKIDGLGTKLNAATQALGAHVTATVAAAVPASAADLPPPPAAQ